MKLLLTGVLAGTLALAPAHAAKAPANESAFDAVMHGLKNCKRLVELNNEYESGGIVAVVMKLTPDEYAVRYRLIGERNDLTDWFIAHCTGKRR